MNISQLFVNKRPIAWTAMISVLVWGIYAYMMMPQRQDPIIPVVTGVILTPYPGAEAEKVEQEVTRKIERKVAENPAVEHVKSISRPGISIVYVELFETERQAELVWQDIRGKLGEIPDLPVAAGKPTQSLLNKDFGDSVAVMLTLSSPPVSDLEIQLRAKSIRDAIATYRKQMPTAMPSERWTAVLIYPSTVARSHVVRMGQTLAQRLTASGTASDVAIVEAPSAGMLDVALRPGKSRLDLENEIDGWKRENVGTDEFDPDVWPTFWIQDMNNLERELRANARDKYTYRELKDFADRIRDRLKQSPYVAQIDMVGNQEERVWLSYSGQRLNQFNITPLSIVGRIQERNINTPGGQFELPQQNVVIRPTGEYTSASEIGQTTMDVSSEGYPLYLRDLVEVTRGYEDPANVMNFRTVKVPRGGEHATTVSNESAEGEEAVPDDYDLQTGRAITISVRQVKGTSIANYDRDMNAALADLKPQLPQDIQLERTSNEPQKVREKIRGFNKNLIEAIVIVVLMSLVFMEWRSALLVAICIPITIAMTLGMSQIVGIDLQQVSIAALIIALGMLVDAPVVAADAINRELAGGQPRHMAAFCEKVPALRSGFREAAKNVGKPAKGVSTVLLWSRDMLGSDIRHFLLVYLLANPGGGKLKTVQRWSGYSYRSISQTATRWETAGLLTIDHGYCHLTHPEPWRALLPHRSEKAIIVDWFGVFDAYVRLLRVIAKAGRKGLTLESTVVSSHCHQAKDALSSPVLGESGKRVPTVEYLREIWQ